MDELLKIDKNFKIETTIDKADLKYIPSTEPCFDVYGLMCTDGRYHRLPPEIAEKVNDGVKGMNYNTAGGRIRFKTNSKYVAVHYNLNADHANGHISALGRSGTDMYLVEDGKQVFYRSFVPFHKPSDTSEQIIEFTNNADREIVIHLPLYNCCKNLHIGVQESAYVVNGSKYKYEKPIVFYGSSITHGACASRPGNAYENHISRYFDTNFINLGFSGSCRGEQPMCDYLASLDMSIFVLDYDHNAPSTEHLENTHENLFRTFREKQPDTPVIIMSMTDVPRSDEAVRNTLKRREIIMKTYSNAIAKGDKNVYFIDGQEIFKTTGGADCTVDGCHPNDLGFWCMGQAVIRVIEENKLL